MSSKLRVLARTSNTLALQGSFRTREEKYANYEHRKEISSSTDFEVGPYHIRNKPEKISLTISLCHTYRNNFLAQYATGAAGADKFTGKRTTLDIKMPNLEEPEESTQIDQANPFVPDLYQSEAKSAKIAAEKAETALPGDVPLPK
ncbi:6706_t:CDS:2, partial [Acaulospora colombiana]